MGRSGLLGELEQLVLLAILRPDGRSYAVPILNQLKEKTALRPARGSIYVTLDRLHRKGHLTSWFADPTPERGGKAKRYFQLTSLGLESLQRSQNALRQMIHPDHPASEGS